MKKFFFISLLFCLFGIHAMAQLFIPNSIHREQNAFFNTHADSVLSNNLERTLPLMFPDTVNLNKRIFGYHPYWAGNAYLNYQWNLLTDFCFFSYEVDPATGGPLSTHDFLNSAAVDSAQANGLDVHLCVTLFSAHSVFFGNADARQNLIDELIWYVQQRNAQGVNMDFEAVPYSLIDEYMLFLADFSQQFHQAVPGGIVSIAMPAVDWSGEFDIAFMNEFIDLYMIMSYDYYWNGSGQAGPVSPLYSMTQDYDFNMSRTLSFYQSEGMPREKTLLGVPYYAREWPTEEKFAPSDVRASGTAYTYEFVKNNNSGFYAEENRYWESSSFSNYYTFEANGWNQCFLEEEYGLGQRYDLVNRRKIAGIGIWALSYDDGYTELWDLIHQKFTDDALPQQSGYIYDSGGPEWDYYSGEDYVLTIGDESFSSLSLEFEMLDLESGFDSLWIYAGSDTLSTLIGAYSGNDIPPPLSSATGYISLHFKSDNGVEYAGWKAYWQGLLTTTPEQFSYDSLKIYPNPASSVIYIEFHKADPPTRIQIFNMQGEKVKEVILSKSRTHRIDLSKLNSGLYLVKMFKNNEGVLLKKIMVR